MSEWVSEWAGCTSHLTHSRISTVSSERCCQARDGHKTMRSYLVCAPPAALASCTAARRVQDCDCRLRSTGPCPATPWGTDPCIYRGPCPPPLLTWPTTVSSLPTFMLDNCVVRRTRSSFGDRTFAAAGPQVCRPISDYVGCHTASLGGYWRHFYLESEATAQSELFLTAPYRNTLTYLLTYFIYLFCRWVLHWWWQPHSHNQEKLHKTQNQYKKTVPQNAKRN